MKKIHSLFAVSISKFKQNPGKVVEDAQGRPVAVLNHNQLAFYTVSPEFMAQMAELYDEQQLLNAVQPRLKSVGEAIKVDIHAL